MMTATPRPMTSPRGLNMQQIVAGQRSRRARPNPLPGRPQLPSAFRSTSVRGAALRGARAGALGEACCEACAQGNPCSGKTANPGSSNPRIAIGGARFSGFGGWGGFGYPWYGAWSYPWYSPYYTPRVVVPRIELETTTRAVRPHPSVVLARAIQASYLTQPYWTPWYRSWGMWGYPASYVAPVVV
jgi:hypothetical protein